jgi:N6-L-threonylcarbamoyladenine synthase
MLELAAIGMRQNMKKRVLALESSCDESALALLEVDFDGDQLIQATALANLIHSQIDLHRPYGGVIPESAARDHLEAFPRLWTALLETHQNELENLDWIAVTLGPGLIGSLLTGLQFAKGLSASFGVPLKGVDHIRAHLSPAFFPLQKKTPWTLKTPFSFPALGLTASGGHTRLTLLNSFINHQILGESSDDACGECLDKVGKLMGFPYPAAPVVEQWAKKSQKLFEFSFPKSIRTPHSAYGFSFSGLKTAALRALCQEEGLVYGLQDHYDFQNIDDEKKADLSFQLQDACFSHLVSRVQLALEHYPQCQNLYVAGGVAANQTLRSMFEKLPVDVHLAPLDLCTDNAMMIALQSCLENQDAWQEDCYVR